ncbi:Myeloma-overexpressed 2-like protein [Leptotrombidium deliense]|uniref:Myeloma-overexpressed 2-like protein n=1 Tax=Leptotrombidium deliense TaxID=299467 RepID=A0A443QBQ5_9ACAR|nr:Myeloma-overexpressed 2-like protein [Leptotrombidium deliense]
MDLDKAGGSAGLLMDLAANEKAAHADFLNNFEDLFDDDDVQVPSDGLGSSWTPPEVRTWPAEGGGLSELPGHSIIFCGTGLFPYVY